MARDSQNDVSDRDILELFEALGIATAEERDRVLLRRLEPKASADLSVELGLAHTTRPPQDVDEVSTNP